MPQLKSISRLTPPTTEKCAISSVIIAKAVPRKKEYFLRDTKTVGFYVRVKPSGKKTFGVQARLNGNGSTLQRTIGDTARYSVTQAREIAKKWLVSISTGTDPKHEAIGKISLVQLLDRYISARALAPRTEADYQYNFKHYLKGLSSKSISAISTEDILSWYNSGRNHPIGTDRTFATISSTLKWAVAAGYIKSNPAEKVSLLIKRPSSTTSHQKLRTLFNNLPKFMDSFIEAEISTVMRDWIVLSISTGLRREESMTLTWQQIDFEQKVVIIEQNKSQRPLVIPMTGLTYDMFQSRFQDPQRDSRYVFFSKPGIAIKDARKALKKICASAGIMPINHHDLRRLFASICDELNLSKDEISTFLNHATKSVTDTYVHRSIENRRPKYNRVVDYLDLTMKTEHQTGEKNQVMSATSVMRAIFYGKVNIEPAEFYSEHETEANRRDYEAYWEGM